MIEIQLTQNKVAFIDDEDFEKVNMFKWQASVKCSYASTCLRRDLNGKRERIFMHRLIMGLKKGDKRQVDHKNHNGLDNRKENLRITDNRGNAENRKNQSKYGPGIVFKKHCNKEKPFQLCMHINGKYTHIGMFSTPGEAKQAREKFLESCLTK